MKVLTILVLSALLWIEYGYSQQKPQNTDSLLRNGVHFLAQSQSPEGFWQADIGYKLNMTYAVSKKYEPHMGITALAGLALLENEECLKDHSYGKNIERAIAFVLSCQNHEGFISKHGTCMYSHAFAVQFLSRYYLQNPQRADVRRSITSAVRVIVESQNPQGGWRYTPYSWQADLSATSCQIEALFWAKRAGIQVPQTTRDRAYGYVRKCANDDGSFKYMPLPSSDTRVSVPLTACGVMSLLMLGVPTEDEMVRKGLSYIQSPPYHDPCPSSNHFLYFYGQFYATRAMFLADDSYYWENWYLKVQGELLSQQGADGSWDDNLSKVWATAQAVRILLTSFGKRSYWFPERDYSPPEPQALAGMSWEELDKAAQTLAAHEDFERAHALYKEMLSRDPNHPIHVSESLAISCRQYYCRQLAKFPERFRPATSEDPKVFPDLPPDKEQNWPTWEGNYTRNRTAQTDIAFQKAWEVSIPIKKTSSPDYFYNEPPQDVPEEYQAKFYPIIYEGQVFINTQREVLAYAAVSGKLLWHWHGLSQRSESLREGPFVHSVTVAEDAVYANVIGESGHYQKQQTWARYLIVPFLPRRILVRLDAKTGQFQWICPDPDLSFLTTPIVLGNTLYAGACTWNRMFTCYMVALDASTGKVLWKVPVCIGQQELNMFFDNPAREVIGSGLAYANGTLYFPTNLGTVAAVSTEGELRWVYRYERIPLPMQWDTPLVKTLYRPVTWTNHPAIYEQGNLLIMPLDSHDLYCLNASTGLLSWKKSHADNIYFMGTYDRQLVMSGKKGVECLSLETGERLQKWNCPIVGRGILCKHSLYFIGPIGDSSWSWHLDISSPKSTPQKMVENNADLMVAVDGKLLAVDGEKLMAFYDRKNRLRHLGELLSKNLHSPFHLLEMAEMLLPDDRTQAFALLEQVLQNSKTGSIHAHRAWNMLCDLFPQEAIPLKDEDPEKVKLEQRLFSYAQKFASSDKMVDIGLHLGKLYEIRREWSEAIRVYEKLWRECPELANAQIARLIGTHGQEIYAPLEQEASKIYQALAQDDREGYERLLLQYPASQTSQRARLQLAQIFMKQSQYGQASQWLKQNRQFLSSPQTPMTLYMLGICYEKQNELSRACEIWNTIENSYPDATILVEEREVNLRKEAEEHLQSPIYSFLRKPDLQLWESETPKFHIPFPSKNILRFLAISGNPVHPYVFLNLGGDDYRNEGKNGLLYCYNGKDGKENWNVRLGWIRSVGFIDNLLFAWGTRQIFSLDPKNGNILWQTEVPYRIFSLTLGENGLAYISSSNWQGYSTVFVREPASGKLLWSANFMTLEPDEILLGQEILVASSKTPSAVCIYQLSDGKLLQRFDDKACHYSPFIFNTKYLCLAMHDRLECYQLPSMKLEWKYDARAIRIRSIVGNEKHICFATEENKIVLLDLFTGNVKWQYPLAEGNGIFRIILDFENVYLLEKRDEKRDEGSELYLLAIEIAQGILKWSQILSEDFNRVDIVHLLTPRYILILSNRPGNRGFQSRVMVYDKFDGRQEKSYELEKTGRTVASFCIREGNLWLVKDNECWVLGK